MVFQYDLSTKPIKSSMMKKNLLVLMSFLLMYQVGISQQQQQLNLSCGQAIGTCFSGVTNQNVYDPNGYVLGMIDVRNKSGATIGQNWPAPMYHDNDWRASRMGQLFGVAIDSFDNIFVTATSVYGVFPWGSAGSGGVYKVDGVTGAVSDYILTGSGPNQIVNFDVGLGNIAYHKEKHQLFATNMEDGKIYRIDATGATSGTVSSVFDPMGPDNGASGFAPLGERLWGIGVYNNRVYYSVWNEDNGRPSGGTANQIYSIALDATTGDFSGAPTCEIDMPIFASNYSNPVSDISFSHAGKMLIAERTMTADMGNVFTGGPAHNSRIMEFEATFPTVPFHCNPIWSAGDIIYIGNFGQGYNSAGGIDYGYDKYDPDTHQVDDCDSLIWGTGDALRFGASQNPTPPNDVVYGFAGMPASGNTNFTSPTWVKTTSYYIDADGNTANASKTQMGDIEIVDCGCEAPCTKNPSTKTFSIIIDTPQNPNGIDANDAGYNGIEDSQSGDLLIAGETSAYVTQDVLVNKMTCDGDVTASMLCQSNFGINETSLWMNEVQPNPLLANGGYVYTGKANSNSSRDLLLKVSDKAGGIVYAQIFGENNDKEEIGHCVIQDQVGDIVSVGVRRSGNTSTVYAVAIDANYVNKWDMEYFIQGDDIAYSVVEMPFPSSSGGIVYGITGKSRNQVFYLLIDASNGKPILPMGAILYDLDNDSQTREIARSITIDQNRDVVFTGEAFRPNNQNPPGQITKKEIFVFKLNSQMNFNPLWIQYYDVIGSDMEFSRHVTADEDNNYIITGIQDIYGGPQIYGLKDGDSFIMSLTKNGAVNWINEYLDPGYNGSAGYRVEPVASGGYYMTGTIWNNEISSTGLTASFDNQYAVATDPDGLLNNCACCSPIEVKQKEYQTDPQKVQVEVIPEPFPQAWREYSIVPIDILSEYCDQYSPDTCLVESFINSFGLGDSCCFALDLNNLDPGLMKIRIDVNTPGVFFDVSTVSTSLNLHTYDPEFIIIDNSSSPIPMLGISPYLKFCLGNTGALVSTQSFTVTYYDMACNEMELCTQEFITDCELECTDDKCVNVIPIQIECDDQVPGKFKFTYRVSNLAPGQVLDMLDFTVVSPTGIILSATSQPITPPIPYGTSSIDQCIDIIDFNNGPYPKTVNFIFGAHGYSMMDSTEFCCHDQKDTLSIVLPNCCDPCEVDWVNFDPISIPGAQECCYNLDIDNTCDDLLSIIRVKSITPGVNIGSNWNPNYGATWGFAPVGSTQVDWSPTTSTYAPINNYVDLIHFCLDNPQGIPNPQVLVEYIFIDATGKEKIICEEILKLECDIDIDCLDIVEHEVICDQNGNYIFNFCILNTSVPAFIADGLTINKLSSTPASIGLIQYNWNSPTPGFPLLSTNTFCGSAQIIGVPAPAAGDVLNLEFLLKNFAQDSCCVESELLTLILPDCCNPCEDDWVTYDPISVPGAQECCYDLNINNTCDDLLSIVRVKSITPGVNLGSHWNPNYGGTWGFTPSGPAQVDWYPTTSTYAPINNYIDLVHFCLDNPQAIPNPQVLVEYIFVDAAGVEKIICEEILELECDQDINCLDIVEHEVICDNNGNYIFNFCILNASVPAFIADGLTINKLSSTPASIGLIQYNWNTVSDPGDFPLSSSGTFCGSAQIIGVPAPSGGDIINLEFLLKNFAQDSCCVESELLTLTLPDCCDELVIDGDFNDPTGSSFTSDLNQNCSCVSNSYCIGSDITDKCAGWSSLTGPQTCSDNFMIIDGFNTPGSIVWSQPVNTVKGKCYEFSFQYHPNTTGGAQPTMNITVGTDLIGVTNGVSGSWTGYSFSYMGTITGTVNLSIVQATVSNQYNDYGIDCISFSCVPCPEICPPIIIIDDNPIYDNVYHAGNRLLSKGVVPQNGNVRFKAGQEIELNPGFEVSGASIFEATIEACCCSDDPLNDLSWIQQYVGDPNYELKRCLYEGQCVYAVSDYCQISDGVTRYFNCDGDLICESSMIGTTCSNQFLSDLSQCTIFQSCQ